MNKILVPIIVILMIFMLAFIPIGVAEKIYWCHCEPNGNCQTLHLPLQALQNAGHMNASGQPLHAGDHS